MDLPVVDRYPNISIFSANHLCMIDALISAGVNNTDQIMKTVDCTKTKMSL